ncbi:N-6 DNA methylase [Microbacterium sp. PMB16]|uniref:N-6 DNA methylase n=1 Tax=Microbacterium sp. PMB16 TaxID=3120157 RepID=UPI003F4B43AE
MTDQPRDVFVNRLASREVRAENEIQADVYGLLTVGGLDLTTEQVARTEVGTGDGTRRRIDVAIGHVTIEVKRDLRTAGILADAETQLAGYVRNRIEVTGADCAGIITDGTEWNLYRLQGDVLERTAILTLTGTAADTDRLVAWLEAILATQSQVDPTPEEIVRRLGADSPAHLYDYSTLRALYATAGASSEVALKRELWGKLLRTALGSNFEDSERLFLNHTLLVLSAEIIAHAAIGFDVSESGGLTPNSLVTGTEFANRQLFGVVEADFFDWVLEVEGGEAFVRTLAKRIAQFRWIDVRHDVLKVLYESVIESSERQRLGEYYTPDWLAAAMVEHVITDPLAQKVLDPSCGSGTFLFHAVRSYLAAAEAAGTPIGESVQGLVSHVFGLDIHPVAVSLGRVTYLLAIGADRLNDDSRGPIAIPVYLGDALQWEQRLDIFAHEDNISVSTAGSDLPTGPEVTLFEDDLVFPRSIVSDASNFDILLGEMANRAKDMSDRSDRALMAPLLRQFAIPEVAHETLMATFHALRSLHARGRDHIWAYYVRNLVRPVWLSDAANQVDVLIGNPPWLAYSKMSPAMQRRYTAMLRDYGLVSGALGASGRDLATLFVVRAADMYLRPEGRMAFVMPHGVLTRQPHSRFRAGVWNGRTSELSAKFETPWDLAAARTGFPMTSCVVFAEKTQSVSPLTAEVELWRTTGRESNVDWETMQSRLSRSAGTVGVTSQNTPTQWSPYRSRFRQGAILAPRVLMMVNEANSGPLGPGAGRAFVESRRTNQEDRLWRDVPGLAGVVERSFIRRIALGETTLPFRQLEPLKAVLPIEPSGRRLFSEADILNHPALAQWWTAAEASFAQNRTGAADESLLDRIDFHGQLSAQLPAPTQRVVYTKAGSTLNASRIESSVIIDHKLYWAPAANEDEAFYLMAILNSKAVLDRVRPFQAVGLFGPRDFDKNVFRALIAPYDAGNATHAELAGCGRSAEALAAELELPEGVTFQRKRLAVRQALIDDGLAAQIEAAVLAAVPEARV